MRFVLRLCGVLSAIALIAVLPGSTGGAGGAEARITSSTGGTVWAWGTNGDGQSGPAGGLRATTVGPRNVVAIAAGAASMALTADGTVLTWGDNFNGALGVGDAPDRTVPGPVAELPRISAIDIGGGTAAAVATDGRLFTWGSNSQGQLGRGTPFGVDVRSPGEVPGVSDAVAVASGGNHMLVLLRNGTVQAWGYGRLGLLGDGGFSDRNVPGPPIADLNSVVAVAAGRAHSLALRADGSVWGWGDFTGGQLGPTFGNFPRQLPGLPAAAAIAGGGDHTLVLGRNGLVYYVGGNFFPYRVISGVDDIVAISAGPRSDYALRRDGVLLAWGDNAKGQLGDETTSPAAEPRQAQLRGISAISSGGDHVLALTTGSGYWMVTRSGGIYSFGTATHQGTAPAQGIVDIEPTPSRRGYWIVDNAGHVYAFGDASYQGGAPALRPGETVTSLSATGTGRGYWLFTDIGRVFNLGDASRIGDLGSTRLNGPILDSVATPSGRGYYMVASDGGVFAFGDAAFRGSMGGRPLNRPVESLVPDGDGAGYWLVASDGGVFAFDAAFRGSMGGQRLNRPITGMVRLGSGYLMVAEDGGVFNFSDRAFVGSLGGNPPPSPVVAVAASD